MWGTVNLYEHMMKEEEILRVMNCVQCCVSVGDNDSLFLQDVNITDRLILCVQTLGVVMWILSIV